MNHISFKKSISILLCIFFMVIIGCKPKTLNNEELGKMVIKDQEMRTSDNGEPLEPADQAHRLRVMELLANGQIKTAIDKFNAALILQHTALTFCNEKLVSISPENYYLAYELCKSAFESGYKEAGYLTAATYDRYMLYTQGYQKYGTQKIYDDKTDQMLWAPIDSSTTDEERQKYNVQPLTELLKENPMKPIE